jgi:hypothetical protein
VRVLKKLAFLDDRKAGMIHGFESFEVTGIACGKQRLPRFTDRGFSGLLFLDTKLGIGKSFKTVMKNWANDGFSGWRLFGSSKSLLCVA